MSRSGAIIISGDLKASAVGRSHAASAKWLILISYELYDGNLGKFEAGMSRDASSMTRAHYFFPGWHQP